MPVYRSALLRFADDGRALYDEDGLLAIGPDAQGRQRVLAAGAWQALATAHAAQGQTLRALRAEGEVPMAHMDYAGAVDRWRAAQDFSRQSPGSAADQIELLLVPLSFFCSKVVARLTFMDVWRVSFTSTFALKLKRR